MESFIEFMFGVGMFLNAGLFIPQALKIYKTKRVDGLSLLTFAGFNAIQSFTILHAFLHQDWLLMGGFMISFLFCGIVTTLIYVYRKKQ